MEFSELLKARRSGLVIEVFIPGLEAYMRGEPCQLKKQCVEYV